VRTMLNNGLKAEKPKRVKAQVAPTASKRKQQARKLIKMEPPKRTVSKGRGI